MFNRVRAVLDWLDERTWIRASIAGAGCFVFVAFLGASDLSPRLKAGFAAVIAVLTYVYRRKSWQPLPNQKPWLACFPKYRVRCTLPGSVFETPDPRVALSDRLAEMGFAYERHTLRDVHFTRGYNKADFSIEIVKLNITFPLPLTAETEFRIAFGWAGGFDTGDLWLLAKKLQLQLEADWLVGNAGPSEAKAA